MGQIADDMVNGICCDICGCYFVDNDTDLFEHGYPATCWDCWKDLTKEEKKIHQKAEVDTL